MPASTRARTYSSGLDEYQRDLEQELADVVELIRRLRAEEKETQAQPQPEGI